MNRLKIKCNIPVIIIITFMLIVGFSVQSIASSLGSIHVELPAKTEVFLYKVVDYEARAWPPSTRESSIIARSSET